MGRMTRTTTTVPTVWPTFVCRDPRAELRFLVEAFGFTERVVYADGDVVHHAELTWPGPDGAPAGGVMFGSVHEEDPCGQPPGGSSIHVVVTLPDELYDRAVAAGAAVVRTPEDTGYGSRQFIVRDPEGNVWSFGTWYE